MPSSNPAFNEKTIEKMRQAGLLEGTDTMTVEGTINKVGLLVVLTMLSSALAWSIADTELGHLLCLGSVIVNLILALIIIFKRETAPMLAAPYALIEGLALGSISYFSHLSYPGIVSNAIIGTFAILFGMVGLYHFRILQATENFVRIVAMSTFAILVIYIVDLVAGLFGHPLPMIHQGGLLGIGFSVLVIGVASMNFIIDFDMIERAAQAKAPRYMEWYAGFSVLVTVIWLYLEILRLLSKLNRR